MGGFDGNGPQHVSPEGQSFDVVHSLVHFGAGALPLPPPQPARASATSSQRAPGMGRAYLAHPPARPSEQQTARAIM